MCSVTWVDSLLNLSSLNTVHNNKSELDGRRLKRNYHLNTRGPEDIRLWKTSRCHIGPCTDRVVRVTSKVLRPSPGVLTEKMKGAWRRVPSLFFILYLCEYMIGPKSFRYFVVGSERVIIVFSTHLFKFHPYLFNVPFFRVLQGLFRRACISKPCKNSGPPTSPSHELDIRLT